jgi:two-component system, LytTR family, sensor kinase
LKKIFLLLTLVIFCNNLFAQNNNLLSELHAKLVVSKDSTRIVTLNKIGRYYVHEDNFDSAKYYFEEAFSLSNKIGLEIGKCWAKNNLGVLHTKYNRFDKALESHLEALRIAEKINSFRDISATNSNIANIYLDQKKYSLAIEHLQKALDAQKKAKDSIGIAIIYTNLSNNYKELNEDSIAAKYNDMGMQICNNLQQRKNNTPLDSVSLVNIRQYLLQVKASLLEKKKEFSQALLIYKQLSEEVSKNEGIEEKATYQKQIASVYSQTGEYAKSLEYANNTLELLKQDSIPDLYKDIYEIQATAYTGLGRYDKAFESQKLFKQINDSVFNKEKLTITSDMQAKYETEKKDAQIIQLNKEKKSQRVITGLTIGIAAIVLGLLVLAYRSRQLKEKLLMQKQQAAGILLEKKATSVELLALRSQMNPHFIFNSLNSISNYILKADTANANLYLSKFSNLMRKNLEQSKNQQINLPDEVKLLELYLELEKLRFGNKMEYTISIAATLLQEDIRIPSMVIQPYVENAVKHGIHPAADKHALIKVEFALTANQLICTIEDNGPGIKATQLQSNNNPDHHPLGANITQNRIDLINSMQEQKIEIEIINKKDNDAAASGTTVKISFPVMVEEDITN